MAGLLGYIPDGHTLTCVINEIPHLHPRLVFTCRRMTSEEFGDYLDSVGSLKEAQAQRLIAAHLAARITDWDMRDNKEVKVPVTEEVTRKLVRQLGQRVWRVISGQEAPDGIIGQASGDAEAEYRAALEAARTGRPLTQVREDAERKNLPSA